MAGFVILAANAFGGRDIGKDSFYFCSFKEALGGGSWNLLGGKEKDEGARGGWLN